MRNIPIPETVLVDLLTHATSAARIVGHSDALAAGELADHVDAIAHELGELLGEPHPSAPLSERIDELRQLIARADALATATGDVLDDVRSEGNDRRRFERLAHLLGATLDAVRAAAEAGDKLAAETSTRRTVA
jgi:hypothetical protein